ncbi:MAG TPA: protein kinase [Polyangia bacterium]|nr:protein kinase [Polyangia bacterium]
MTRVLDGRYRVLARIGSGGMGAVYRVEHVRLGKIAAMKVLHASSASDREMVKRFWLEAQSVSRLNHPNIVQTFDFGQWTGALYLVMEYVTGDDLAAVVRREGPIEFGRAARFFAQVCSALTEAHEHGIIHRDLKPENLMLTRRRDGAEHAKVLDFGLAKLREREESSAITAGARIVGTPYYMSPEQVRGEALDGRADVYSLGATLYRVLTGFPPFHASTPMGVLTKHVTDEVVPPRARAPDLALPPAADEIVLRAMAKSVDDRYATAAELQRDLAAAVDDVPLAAGVSARTRSQARLARERAAERATVSLPTPGSELDEGSPESPARLRRSDIDDFERALRWRRIATRILLPLVFVGAVAGGTALYLRTGGEKADVVEHEPNNTPGYANLLPMGTTVRGTIGALLANGQGDVDYYRVPAGGGLRVLSARLEGVPGVDLVLELFDGQGKRLAKADAHGRGGGERLQPISIPSTDVFLAVREVWIQGIPPTVSSDRYALTVRWGSPEPGWELEPNDWEAAATRVVAGASVRGYLGDLEDKDWFAVSSPTDGELTVRVTPPAEVDVVLLRSGEKATPVNRRGPGGVEEWTTSISAGTPVLVGVTRKLALNKEPKEPKDLKDPKAQSLTGLDEPYELTTTVRPN